MQNPKTEIAGIVGVLTSTVDRKLLRDTINNNFTEDASIDHPLCIIKSSEGSRQKLLGAYEWYRLLSPHTKSHVESVVYDAKLDVLIVEVVQTLHIRFVPFKPVPGRLIVRLILKRERGKHYIHHQEDYIHPNQIANFVLPPLSPIVTMTMVAGGIVSDLAARIFLGLGFGPKEWAKIN